MSYSSNYNLNQRISYLEYIIQQIAPQLPLDLQQILSNGNSAGTFDIDLNNNDILQVDNIQLNTINGGAYPPAPTASTLANVLIAGNSAGLTDIAMNGQNITNAQNVNTYNLNTTTINNSAYPPSVPIPPLSSVLNVNNSAGTHDINLNNNDLLQVDNINLNTINGGAYPPSVPTPALSAVLAVGNTANSNIVLTNTAGLTDTLGVNIIQLLNQTTGYNNNTDITAQQVSVYYDTNPVLNPNQTYYQSIVQGGSISCSSVDNTQGITYTAQLTNGAGLALDSNTAPLYNNIQTIVSSNSVSGQGQIQITDTTAGVPAPLNVIASSLLLNGVPFSGGSQNIEQVLIVGNNANNQSITGLNNVDLITINGSAYPPSVPVPNLNSVLGSGNSTGGFDIDMNSANIVNCNNINTTFINGLTPTTIGLNWADFTGTNAYNNLPSSLYKVDNGSGFFTEQQAVVFNAYNTGASQNSSLNYQTLSFNQSSNEYIRLDQNGGSPYLKIGYDTGSSQYTYIDQNQFFSSAYNTTYFSYDKMMMEMVANSYGHLRAYNTTTLTNLPILIDCAYLSINGSTYFPSPKRFYQDWNASYSLSSGSMYNIGSNPTPLSNIPAGWYSLNFSAWCDNPETSGQCYIEFYGQGFGNYYYPTQFGNNGRYLNNITTNGLQNTTQFTMANTIYIGTTDSYFVNIYLGHTGGSWTGNCYWSVCLVEL